MKNIPDTNHITVIIAYNKASVSKTNLFANISINSFQKKRSRPGRSLQPGRSHDFCYFTSTVISLGNAFSVLGRVSVITPFLYCAEIFSALTVSGRPNERSNLP